MFDPTAFENMKVVMEGALYDRDLSGEITVVDRNDFINAAKLSRKYETVFSVRPSEDRSQKLLCSIVMEAALENLAAELLPAVQSQRLAGCQVSIKFFMIHKNEEAIFQKIEKTLQDIWGTRRIIKQVASWEPFSGNSFVNNEATIRFGRLIYEDQLDDLVMMVDYMIKTLMCLEKLLY